MRFLIAPIQKVFKRYHSLPSVLSFGAITSLSLISAVGMVHFQTSSHSSIPSSVSTSTSTPVSSSPLLSKLPASIVDSKISINDQLAYHYTADKPFVALALGVENIPSKPYVDACGVNLGAGYCVTVRMKTKEGRLRVDEELRLIGLSSFDRQVLMSPRPSPKLLERISITPSQSIHLLEIVKKEYEGIAKRAVDRSVGEDHFHQLPTHKQDVLTYLAYNLGNQINQYSKLFSMIANGHSSMNFHDLTKEMTPKFKDSKGRVRTNDRLGFWAGLMWQNPSQFQFALLNKGILDRFVIHKKTSPSLSGLAFNQDYQHKQLIRKESSNSLFSMSIPSPSTAHSNIHSFSTSSSKSSPCLKAPSSLSSEDLLHWRQASVEAPSAQHSSNSFKLG